MKMYGNNDGRFTPDPGTVELAQCGICDTRMIVERNILGPTSWAEMMSRHEHLHDSFTCPHLQSRWHQKAVALLWEARNTHSELLRAIIISEAEKIVASKTVPE